MTVVTGNIADLTATGTVPAAGWLRVSLLRPVVDDPIVTTHPIDLTVLDGDVAFTVAPSAVDNAYLIDTRAFAGLPRWCVQVPDVASITLTELVTDHQVDPATLDPAAEAPAAWTIALAETNTEVAEVRALAEAGSTPEQLESAIGAFFTENPVVASDTEWGDDPYPTLIFENGLA